MRLRNRHRVCDEEIMLCESSPWGERSAASSEDCEGGDMDEGEIHLCDWRGVLIRNKRSTKVGASMCAAIAIESVEV